MTGRRALLALTGVAALAATPALASGTRKTIDVADNYYAPAKVTVKPGTTLRWRWTDEATDVHDVKLAKAPSGVKKFQSDPLAAGDTFSRKLTKPGTYRFICTFHEEEMFMTVRVKRRAS